MSHDYYITESKRTRLQDAARAVHEYHQSFTEALATEAAASNARYAAERRLGAARQEFTAACGILLPEDLASV